MRLVTVHVARSPELAELAIQQLRDEGIPAVVHGASLMDEFASAHKLMGTLACEVKVREADLARAREVLGEAAVPAAPTPLTTTQRRTMLWLFALLLVVPVALAAAYVLTMLSE